MLKVNQTGMASKDNLIRFSLYAGGLAYWYFFYFRGAPSITHGDWLKEQLYLDTIRMALQMGRVPWLWEEAFYHGVTFFMANAEVAYTPDVLLLPFISNNTYFYLHQCIFFTIGFYSLNRIAKEIQLGTLSYLFLYLVFNFNGYITSHISEGHFQWTGYYLIPAFLYALYKRTEIFVSFSRSDVVAGLILGLLFCNGSFHIVAWLSLFTLMFFLFQFHGWGRLLLILGVGYGIGLFRIIPALLYFPPSAIQGIQSGYTDLILLLNALTQLRGHGYGETTVMGWWEYSLYVGFSGFFILICGTYAGLQKQFQRQTINWPWIIATALIFLLALGNTWGILSTLRLPFGTIERVSTRFIVIPFLICAIFSAYVLNDFLTKKRSKRIDFFVGALLLCLSADLFFQLLNWSLGTTQIAAGGAKVIPAINILDTPNDRYKLSVYTAWLLSSLFILLGLRLLTKAKPAQ